MEFIFVQLLFADIAFMQNKCSTVLFDLRVSIFQFILNLFRYYVTTSFNFLFYICSNFKYNFFWVFSNSIFPIY